MGQPKFTARDRRRVRPHYNQQNQRSSRSLRAVSGKGSFPLRPPPAAQSRWASA